MTRLRSWCVSVLVMAAVGCAPVAPGAAGPADGTADPSPTSTAPRTAPPVAAPKDARGVAACAFLTDAQLGALALDPGSAKPNKIPTLDGCGWKGPDQTYGLLLTVDVLAERGGLENLYRERQTYRVFESSEIDGYPAVHAEIGIGESLSCTIFVGLSDTQMFFFLASSPRRQLADSCARARQAASGALSNLPPAR